MSFISEGSNPAEAFSFESSNSLRYCRNCNELPSSKIHKQICINPNIESCIIQISAEMNEVITVLKKALNQEVKDLKQRNKDSELSEIKLSTFNKEMKIFLIEAAYNIFKDADYNKLTRKLREKERDLDENIKKYSEFQSILLEKIIDYETLRSNYEKKVQCVPQIIKKTDESYLFEKDLSLKSDDSDEIWIKFNQNIIDLNELQKKYIEIMKQNDELKEQLKNEQTLAQIKIEYDKLKNKYEKKKKDLAQKIADYDKLESKYELKEKDLDITNRDYKIILNELEINKQHSECMNKSFTELNDEYLKIKEKSASLPQGLNYLDFRNLSLTDKKIQISQSLNFVRLVNEYDHEFLISNNQTFLFRCNLYLGEIKYRL